MRARADRRIDEIKRSVSARRDHQSGARDRLLASKSEGLIRARDRTLNSENDRPGIETRFMTGQLFTQASLCAVR